MGEKWLLVIKAQKSQLNCGVTGDEWETSGATSPFGVVNWADRYRTNYARQRWMCSNPWVCMG